MSALQTSDTNVIELGSVGAQPKSGRPSAPINLKTMAEYLSCSYKTLRSNWIQAIESAYDAVETIDPVRDENNLLTEFGIDCIFGYEQHLSEGGNRNTFASVVSQRYSKTSANPTTEYSSALAVTQTTPVEIVHSDELATLLSQQSAERHNAYQAGITAIEGEFTDRASTRNRLSRFVNELYSDRVDELKTKAALKAKLQQVADADQAIAGLDDDLESLLKTVVPSSLGNG